MVMDAKRAFLSVCICVYALECARTRACVCILSVLWAIKQRLCRNQLSADDWVSSITGGYTLAYILQRLNLRKSYSNDNYTNKK